MNGGGAIVEVVGSGTAYISYWYGLSIFRFQASLLMEGCGSATAAGSDHGQQMTSDDEVPWPGSSWTWERALAAEWR